MPVPAARAVIRCCLRRRFCAGLPVSPKPSRLPIAPSRPAQPYHGQTDTGCAFQTPRDARLREKKLVLISTCGYASAEGMYEALLKQYDLLCHGRNYTPIFCPEGELMQVEQLAIPRRRLLSRLEDAGREYARAFTLPEQTLRLLQTPLVDPRVYQIIAAAHWSGAKGEPCEKER